MILVYEWGAVKPRRRSGHAESLQQTRVAQSRRGLNGPWLLFDNQSDPYQLKNLCNDPEHATLQTRLDALLSARLKETKDESRPGGDYIAKWTYDADDSGTVRYTN
ncbi:MAG TPA: hypothetical protein VLI39_20575 [Sedimentisphaerales bacterium]|nr:hypothetical protein [Sedimentisphaerales bacterium]